MSEQTSEHPATTPRDPRQVTLTRDSVGRYTVRNDRGGSITTSSGTEELSPVEHAILLVATFELANMIETPYRVVINEAIELTKEFGGADGHKFVNGVLDKLAPQLRAVEVEAARNRPRG